MFGEEFFIDHWALCLQDTNQLFPRRHFAMLSNVKETTEVEAIARFH